MRFGRIILAVLAPLVSLPALKTDLGFAANAASADSFAGLLRSVAPMATVYATETQHVAGAHSAPVAPPVFARFVMPASPATWSPATAATLRLLTRRHNRLLLRC